MLVVRWRCVGNSNFTKLFDRLTRVKKQDMMSSWRNILMAKNQ